MRAIFWVLYVLDWNHFRRRTNSNQLTAFGLRMQLPALNMWHGNVNLFYVIVFYLIVFLARHDGAAI